MHCLAEASDLNYEAIINNQRLSNAKAKCTEDGCVPLASVAVEFTSIGQSVDEADDKRPGCQECSVEADLLQAGKEESNQVELIR